MNRRKNDLVPNERRFNNRNAVTVNSSVRARVVNGKKRAIVKIINISHVGALIHAPGLDLKKNTKFGLTFMVTLNNGKLVKLYYKEALVIHITRGNIGCMIGNVEKTMI